MSNKSYPVLDLSTTPKEWWKNTMAMTACWNRHFWKLSFLGTFLSDFLSYSKYFMVKIGVSFWKEETICKATPFFWKILTMPRNLWYFPFKSFLWWYATFFFFLILYSFMIDQLSTHILTFFLARKEISIIFFSLSLSLIHNNESLVFSLIKWVRRVREAAKKVPP